MHLLVLFPFPRSSFLASLLNPHLPTEIIKTQGLFLREYNKGIHKRYNIEFSLICAVMSLFVNIQQSLPLMLAKYYTFFSPIRAFKL